MTTWTTAIRHSTAVSLRCGWVTLPEEIDVLDAVQYFNQPRQWMLAQSVIPRKLDLGRNVLSGLMPLRNLQRIDTDTVTVAGSFLQDATAPIAAIITPDRPWPHFFGECIDIGGNATSAKVNTSPTEYVHWARAASQRWWM
jgi:hypothetical protein